MKRLKIGVDVDGIINDFTYGFRKEASNLLGREIKGMPATWELDSLPMTKREVSQTWEQIRKTDNWFYINGEALPGVAMYLPWLTIEHETYFISSRSETSGLPVKQQTEMFLCELGVQFPTVIIAEKKGPIVSALHLDAFVDDKVKNLQNIEKASPNTKLFLMDLYPSNEKEMGSWTHVKTFKEYIEKIEALSNE